MSITIQEGDIVVEVGTLGAEIKSIRRRGREYLWNGDPKFWGRHAPILFPIVGRLSGNRYHIGDKTYEMGQHGFARDSQFSMTGQRSNEVFMRMLDTDETYARYPYHFSLEVRHYVENNVVGSAWEVENLGGEDMYFQIGAHPAFMIPDFDPASGCRGYVTLEGDAPYKISLAPDTFANDALIYEGTNRLRRATLTTAAGEPAVSVRCPAADVWGVWAPHKADCPFVCIEPWCGRKDNAGFCGDFLQRDYTRRLEPGKRFLFDYTVELY